MIWGTERQTWDVDVIQLRYEPTEDLFISLYRYKFTVSNSVSSRQES